jgi:hypothetical protein
LITYGVYNELRRRKYQQIANAFEAGASLSTVVFYDRQTRRFFRPKQTLRLRAVAVQCR